MKNFITPIDAAYVTIMWALFILCIETLFTVFGLKKKRIHLVTVLGGIFPAIGIFILLYSRFYTSIDESVVGPLREISTIAMVSILAFLPLNILTIAEFISSDPTRIALRKLSADRKIRKFLNAR